MQFHRISHNSPAAKINVDEIKASIERKIHSLYEARYTPQNLQTLLQKIIIQADWIVSGDSIYRMAPGGVYQAITLHESEHLARDSLMQKVECDYKKVFSEIEHILKRQPMTVMQELLDFVRELIEEVTTVVFMHVSHHTFCDLVSHTLDCIRNDAFDRLSNTATGVFSVNGIVHTTVPYRAITSKEQMRPMKITKQLPPMEIPKTPSQIPPKSLNGIKHRPEQLEALQGLLANAILSNSVEPQTFVQFTGSGAARIVSEIKAFAGPDYVAAIPCAFTIASSKAPKIRDHGSRILIFDSSNSNVRSAGKALEKLKPEQCAALPIICTEADGTPIMAEGWKCLYVTCDESNRSNSTVSNTEWFQWLLGAFQKPKQYELQALLQSPNEISDTLITELLQAFVNDKEIVANSHSNPSKIRLSDVLRQIQHRATTAGMTSLKLTQKTIARILEHRLGFTIANQHNRLFVRTSGR